MTRRHYPDTVRVEVSRRREGGADVPAIARELGLSQTTVYRWLRADRAAGAGDDDRSAPDPVG